MTFRSKSKWTLLNLMDISQIILLDLTAVFEILDHSLLETVFTWLPGHHIICLSSYLTDNSFSVWFLLISPIYQCCMLEHPRAQTSDLFSTYSHALVTSSSFLLYILTILLMTALVIVIFPNQNMCAELQIHIVYCLLNISP